MIRRLVLLALSAAFILGGAVPAQASRDTTVAPPFDRVRIDSDNAWDTGDCSNCNSFATADLATGATTIDQFVGPLVGIEVSSVDYEVDFSKKKNRTTTLDIVIDIDHITSRIDVRGHNSLVVRAACGCGDSEARLLQSGAESIEDEQVILSLTLAPDQVGDFTLGIDFEAYTQSDVGETHFDAAFTISSITRTDVVTT